MDFLVGTHMPNWMFEVDVPLFLSRRRMLRLPRKIRKATAPWALDSGGFSELSMYGRWTVTAEQYVGEVRTWQCLFGGMRWAAIQDWMCEPWILEKTGLTIDEHQRRTVDSYMELTDLHPAIPFVPVIQGWTLADYMRCVELYETRGGVDLKSLRLVGLGSVCRRQGTTEAVEIVSRLAATGLRLHGFGFKVQGLRTLGTTLASADSLAWSYSARKHPAAMLPECTHDKCGNCKAFMLAWRENVMRQIGNAPHQMALGLN